MSRWTSSLSPKGQITLPVEVRRKLGLSPRDPVAIVMEGDEVRIESPLAQLRATAGIAGRLPRPMTEEEIKDAVDADRAERYVEHLRRESEPDAAVVVDERRVVVVG